MKFSFKKSTAILGGASSVLLLLSGATDSLAAPGAAKPKKTIQYKKVTQETYAATEDENVFSTTTSTEPLPTPTPTPAPKTVAKPAAHKSAALKPTTVAKSTPLAFDPVPSDQVDAISQRLVLVVQLIRRHQRAYDYRVHTVRELENILAQLDGGRAQIRKAPLPAPAAPAPVAAPAPIDTAPMPAPKVESAPAPAAEQPEPLPTPSEEDEIRGGNEEQSSI